MPDLDRITSGLFCVLPSVGPDWGFCVAAPAEKNGFPLVLAALRVGAGGKQPPVDQAILKAVDFFAGLAVFDHIRTRKDTIRLQTMMQGTVEVK